jgi:hypothetical protein
MKINLTVSGLDQAQDLIKSIFSRLQDDTMAMQSISKLAKKAIEGVSKSNTIATGNRGTIAVQEALLLGGGNAISVVNPKAKKTPTPTIPTQKMGIKEMTVKNHEIEIRAVIPTGAKPIGDFEMVQMGSKYQGFIATGNV